MSDQIRTLKNIFYKLTLLKYPPTDAELLEQYLSQFQDCDLEILKEAVNRIFNSDDEFPRPKRVWQVYNEIILERRLKYCNKCRKYENKDSHKCFIVDNLKKQLDFASGSKKISIAQEIKKYEPNFNYSFEEVDINLEKVYIDEQLNEIIKYIENMPKKYRNTFITKLKLLLDNMEVQQ